MKTVRNTKRINMHLTSIMYSINYLRVRSRGIINKKVLKFSKQASEYLNLDYRVKNPFFKELKFPPIHP